MDALNDYLENLAELGSPESRGSFTVAANQVWSRLRQSLNDEFGSPRYLLRWLHQQGAPEIRLQSDRKGLTIRAALPAVPAPESLDYAGSDIDLTRSFVSLEKLPSAQSRFELDDGATRWRWNSERWDSLESSGGREFEAQFSGGSHLISRWTENLQSRFQFSPVPIHWNQKRVSGPYSFAFPVLVWRHLPRREPGRQLSFIIKPPPSALGQYRTHRHPQTDVALAMACGPCNGFWTLRHGELSPLPQANTMLPGLGGLIQAEHLRLDIQGETLVKSSELQSLLRSFRNESLDMVLQLYNLESPLTPAQAEGGFLGLIGVLLHLLDEQRFTEGHLLAEWLRPSLAAGSALENFRYGHTFDLICSLLAEPAGHPQTALRWQKQADNRVREQAVGFPAVREEALLINARLELRARRGKTRGLSGDLYSRLLQLAHQQKKRGEFARAASIFHLLGHSFQTGDPERLEHFQSAVECDPSPTYRAALKEETHHAATRNT